jgi:hypothetical protein
MTDIASAIVGKIELSDTKSALVLKSSIFRAFATLGIDVDKLRKDALANEISRLGKTPKKKAKNSQEIGKLEGRATGIALSGKDNWGAHTATSELDRLDWAVARLKDKMEHPHYQSAVELRRVYSIKCNIDTEFVTRDQDAAVKKFNAVWSHLNAETKFVVCNFVFDDAPPSYDAPLTLMEFGKLYGDTTNDSRARGCAEGVLKHVCGVVHHTMQNYGAWQAQKVAAVPRKISESERKFLEGRR